MRWLPSLLLLCLAVGFACGCAGKQDILIHGTPSDSVGGFAPGTLRLVNDRVRAAAQEGDICGGVLVIRRAGETADAVSFGKLREGDAARVQADTLFDVASLTKPLAGLPLGLLLYSAAETSDRREFISRLLSHTSQLDDETDYASVEQKTPAQWQTISADRIRKNGNKTVYKYANTNYAVASFLLGERAAPLIPFLQQDVWRNSTGFSFSPGHDNVAASGFDARNDELVGTPFDPLANHLLAETKFVPLHSGLFASAPAIAEFVDRMMNSDEEEASDYQRTLRRFLFPAKAFEVQGPDGARLHVGINGLVSPTSPPYAPEGARPGRIYYQTGYTGCLLWVDTQAHITLVLLTNASLTDAQERQTKLAEDILQILFRGMKR